MQVEKKSSKLEYLLLGLFTIILISGVIVWNTLEGLWLITSVFFGVAVLIAYIIQMLKNRFPNSKIAKFFIEIFEEIKDFFSFI